MRIDNLCVLYMNDLFNCHKIDWSKIAPNMFKTKLFWFNKLPYRELEWIAQNRFRAKHCHLKNLIVFLLEIKLPVMKNLLQPIM